MSFVEKIITVKEVGVFIATGGKGVNPTLDNVTPTMEAVITLKNVANEVKQQVFKKDRRWKLPQGFILEYRNNTGMICVKAPNHGLFIRFKRFAKAYEFYSNDDRSERSVFVEIKKVNRFTLPKSWEQNA